MHTHNYNHNLVLWFISFRQNTLYTNLKISFYLLTLIQNKGLTHKRFMKFCGQRFCGIRSSHSWITVFPCETSGRILVSSTITLGIYKYLQHIYKNFSFLLPQLSYVHITYFQQGSKLPIGSKGCSSSGDNGFDLRAFPST